MMDEQTGEKTALQRQECEVFQERGCACQRDLPAFRRRCPGHEKNVVGIAKIAAIGKRDKHNRSVVMANV